uniref:Uncharacterized protein n=1 Tax=Parascaris univalens TaxID=6257 RepID=A0A915CG95_PARUN
RYSQRFRQLPSAASRGSSLPPQPPSCSPSIPVYPPETNLQSYINKQFNINSTNSLLCWTKRSNHCHIQRYAVRCAVNKKRSITIGIFEHSN